MTVINITPPGKLIPPDRLSLFALGFRPFFVLAALSAVVLMLLWLLMLANVVPGPGYYPPSLWHGHEMVFGFATAVVAGFLLTAVRNWTSVNTLTGGPLMGLAALWLAARLLPFLAAPSWLIAVVDLAFLPLLALALLKPILDSKKTPQLIFVVILSVMFIANLLSHLALLDVIGLAPDIGITLALNCILLTIVIMAGRVLPFFIERGAPGSRPKKWPWLERLSVASMVLFALLMVWQPAGLVLSVVAIAAALAHGVRLAAWVSRPLWAVPLLWVLIFGYAWLVIGFVMVAWAPMLDIDTSLARHAFAASIAVLSLGMMARVALGHTGRELKPAVIIGWAFAVLNVAMVLRLLAMMVETQWPLWLAAIGWISAFGIYLGVYWPILSRARVDGQPG